MSSEETERRLLWAALIAGSALSLIMSYRVLTLSLVLGSVEGRWVYEYLQRFPRRAFTPGFGPVAPLGWLAES